jgi:carbamoyl-phosphate synthase large subunit
VSLNGRSKRNGINVLFTSVGRRVELLRAFRQAYVDLRLEGSIVAVDIDPLAPALGESTRPYLVPHLSDADYIPTLVEICDHERIDLIFPLIDPEIPVLAHDRRRLESTGARLVALTAQSVATVADKLRTASLFHEIGVPTPRSWSAHEAREDVLEYPVFVKPRFGSGGEHAVKVLNEQDLAFFLDYVPAPIVQEFLSGPEITSDVLCDLDGAGKVLAVVSRQRIAVRTGEVSKGVTIRNPEIIEYCVAVAQGLEAIGPITVQCILRDGRPYFTEVNPRFGGGLPLALAAGAPFPRWLLSIAAGHHLQVPPLGSYEVGLYLSRYDESLFISEEERAGVPRHRLRS